MGIPPWDLGPGFGFSFVEPVGTPRLTVRCEYPGSDSPPDEVCFRLSPSYGIHNAREAHDWFLKMMREHEEFKVETVRGGDGGVDFGLQMIFPQSNIDPSVSVPQRRRSRGAQGMNRRSMLFIIGSLVLPLGCSDATGPMPMVITTSLPDAGQNVEYSETLTATGGDGNYEWSVLVGTTPTGLSLNASTGEISGTPTVVETQHFTVQVETAQQTAQQALSIAVGLRQVLQPSDLCSDPYAYAIATFEDANLEAAVRALLSVGTQEDLTCGLLDNLTGLMADSAGIESLVGIQNLTSLTNLNLDGNPISDISPRSRA